MERNLIQVFGLPRSGTNFMEWTLNNNFEDVNYVNIYAKCNTVGLREFGKRCAFKHSYPTLERSDYALVIHKSYDEWVESMKKDKRGAAGKEIYDEYLKVANNLPKDKTLIVNFKEAYDDYENLVKHIGELINKEPKKEIKKPVGRLTRGGAGAGETNEKFKIRL